MRKCIYATDLAFISFLILVFSGCAGPENKEAVPQVKGQAAVSVMATASSENGIQWAVQNRFRLFDYVKNQDAEKSAELLRSYAEEKDLSKSAKLVSYSTMADMAEKEMGSPLKDMVDGDPNQLGPWHADKQSYSKEYAREERGKHRVSFSLDHQEEGNCKWTIGKGNPVELPCQKEFVTNDVPSSFQVSVEVINTGEQFSLSGKISERRILAIGDSYASGEGNPDVPTSWNKGFSPSVSQTFPGAGWGTKGNGAKWWDHRCHRSFWSQQMNAALSMALSDVHSVYTFLSYSCSGAEIFDGLLMPQKDPPGSKHHTPYGHDACSAEGSFSIREKCKGERYSQLSAAARDICGSERSEETPVFQLGKPWGDVANKVVKGYVCQNKPKVDTLLISVGGNDMGFAPVVKWMVAPNTADIDDRKWVQFIYKKFVESDFICPSVVVKNNVALYTPCKPPSAEERIQQILPILYDRLNIAIGYQLKLDAATKIFITHYPDTFQDENKKTCDSLGEDDPLWRTEGKFSVQASWDGALYLAHKYVRANNQNPNEGLWSEPLNIFPKEARQVEGPMLERMNEKIKSKSTEFGWVDVSSQIEKFQTHGWCALLPNTSAKDNEFVMPGIDRGGVTAKAPSEWQPYKSRGRWLRTINDALLTQWVDEDANNGGYSGAFHPTAEGHYAVGKSVFEKWLENQELKESASNH